MLGGTGALQIEGTLLGTKALKPPPLRHALLVFVLALAFISQVGTIGWGDLYNETDSQYAGAAREMHQAGEWLLPTNNGLPRVQKPPLLYWLILLSYKIFGVSEAAARLPLALANVGMVAVIFLLGERLANFWRGFTASLIFLCSAGVFILARIIMPEPLLSFLMATSLLCAVAGYQDRKKRFLWFGGAWFCLAFACLTKTFYGLLMPAAMLLLAALFFREARIRFRGLLRWQYFVLFLVIVLPWHVWAQIRFPGFFQYYAGTEWLMHLIGREIDGLPYNGVPRAEFLALHFAWWFPWSLAILPGAVLAWRGRAHWKEMQFEDALPVIWMAVGMIPLMFIGQRQDYYAMTMWGAFALWAAKGWEYMKPTARAIGCVLVSVIGAMALGIALGLPAIVRATGNGMGRTTDRSTAWKAITDLSAAEWLSFRPLLAIVGISLLVLGLLALYLAGTNRLRAAIVALALAMIPTGFCTVEGMARMAPFFSLADAARYLNPRLHPDDTVIIEDTLGVASSLVFYLNKRFHLVNQVELKFPRGTDPELVRNSFIDETKVFEKWAAPPAVYLIVERDRVPYWRTHLIDKFHIFHQEMTCGTYVLLSNQH